MNIISIGFSVTETEKYRNILEPISSANDLQFFHLGQEAIEFFNNAVIPSQLRSISDV
ncbi:hypothetical protein [Pedobacter sp. V48]|uniref:hypothetical protein n=1 Tax=Pedobacter sp. V48 TaxID=509635 RepID=UPI0003E49D3E|nr:hypothetical protein [Pedobacter sp. V48]ETZ22848.1 hypothetical protein N824_21400 [Pedobacter sp. V48]